MTNRFASVLPALLMLACVSSAVLAAADDEAELRHIKTVLWPQAYREQDVALLDRLLDDSFQLIDAEGNRSTKQGELEYLGKNRWDPGEFEYRIERLDVYDNGVAIVAGEGVATNYSYRSSNVLIKRDGRWRAVASHVSGVRSRASVDGSE
jgi:hypothetical protein